MFSVKIIVYVRAKSLQSCLTLCNPMDCSLPGSSAHGILQARILEWAAMPHWDHYWAITHLSNTFNNTGISEGLCK